MPGFPGKGPTSGQFLHAFIALCSGRRRHLHRKLIIIPYRCTPADTAAATGTGFRPKSGGRARLFIHMPGQTIAIPGIPPSRLYPEWSVWARDPGKGGGCLLITLRTFRNLKDDLDPFKKLNFHVEFSHLRTMNRSLWTVPKGDKRLANLAKGRKTSDFSSWVPLTEKGSTKRSAQ